MEDKKYSKLKAAFEATQPQLPADFTERVMERLQHPEALSTISRPPEATPTTKWRWVAAAAIILLVAGGATALFTHSRETDDDCVAFVYGERTTDQAVVLKEMQKTMTAVVATDGDAIVEEQLKSMFCQ